MRYAVYGYTDYGNLTAHEKSVPLNEVSAVLSRCGHGVIQYGVLYPEHGAPGTEQPAGVAISRGIGYALRVKRNTPGHGQ